MKRNAAGLIVRGELNPNWRGGKVQIVCIQCSEPFLVIQSRKDKAKLCSLRCWSSYAQGKRAPSRRKLKPCKLCGKPISCYPRERVTFCSNECHNRWRSNYFYGPNNPNWRGGISNEPYPWNFSEISKEIIAFYGKCMNPSCEGRTPRMSTHHVNYDKADCSARNLIAICNVCNSVANFKRESWQELYSEIVAKHLAMEHLPFKFVVIR